ncbi:LacI family DNA-binding transcriptional regulator [Treponema sp.]|uniref:LacI family DNA-binding transcriptional regulator n=1 Tax=Treponema sp. TaxID=166 RepID=UPI00298D98F3|nr:LacI family DNA-binding transcriptional regulator [Treponema sp.]MCR5613324.1 LacI family transcriptional regulator [Treponema sp.]
MVTQKDVATLAGVSFITVSRVINGESNVKEETRKKVQDAIDQLGYTPSFAGKVLNSGRCNTIAVLTPIPFNQIMRTAYLFSVLSGIEEACSKNDNDILLNIVPVSSDSQSYDYLRPFKQKKVDGIIYIGLKQIPENMITELVKRNLPCVVVGDRPESSHLSWVDSANYEAGYNCTKKIWEAGHRKIAFANIKDEIFNPVVEERKRGFIQALKDLGADYNPEDFIIKTDFDSTNISSDFKSALAEWKEKPTAIFCCSDAIVPQAIKGIRELGLCVPEDISIVGFDGFITPNYFCLDIATNVQPLAAMGKRAAEILFKQISESSITKKTEIFSVEFKDGETLKKF